MHYSRYFMPTIWIASYLVAVVTDPNLSYLCTYSEEKRNLSIIFKMNVNVKIMIHALRETGKVSMHAWKRFFERSNILLSREFDKYNAPLILNWEPAMLSWNVQIHARRPGTEKAAWPRRLTVLCTCEYQTLDLGARRVMGLNEFGCLNGDFLLLSLGLETLVQESNYSTVYSFECCRIAQQRAPSWCWGTRLPGVQRWWNPARPLQCRRDWDY